MTTRSVPVIDVAGLSKSFAGKPVVQGFSLRVLQGEIFGFLGPNGSGKTTTIRMLCGLLTPDSGRGTCLGHDILREAAAIKRQVGYMTQRFSLWEDLSVRENLDFVARIYAVPQRRQAVDRALEQLGLGARGTQLAGHLSGGWKQRLALAACILHAPKLLLLDEPTAGVDPQARREFWEQIHALAAAGMTVLVSTHYMDEAERCHRIAYLAWGRLLTQGTVEEVIRGSRLVTWTVTGERTGGLAEALRREPGVLLVAAFGNALHVSGTDGALLERSTARYRADPALRWRQDEPSLEDVFILNMQHAAEQPA
jgi:ABC-2 type transport system ATP-binding protein